LFYLTRFNQFILVVKINKKMELVHLSQCTILQKIYPIEIDLVIFSYQCRIVLVQNVGRFKVDHN
jgi:hypothetical protein